MRIKKLITKLVICLSRRNYSIDKIKHYQQKFIYWFLPILIVTTFKVDVADSLIISARVYFLIINLVILGLLTLIFYLYVEYFEEIRKNYLYPLLKDHKQIVCAYSDKNFGNTIYEIEYCYDSWSNSHNNPHIHTITGDVYNFDDWRSFKFVGMKESRKLKLERLKNIMGKE